MKKKLYICLIKEVPSSVEINISDQDKNSFVAVFSLTNQTSLKYSFSGQRRVWADKNGK